jgi:uncharacterized protein (TIGR04255 family)
MAHYAQRVSKSLKLSNPPVRMVILSLFYPVQLKLRVAHLADHMKSLAADLPVINEDFPLPFWEDLTESAQESTVEEDFAVAFPLFEFTDALEQRAIAFQADRFMLRWSFAEENKERQYPGFDTLSRELWSRFEEFNVSLESAGQSRIEISEVQCFYSNDLTHGAGERSSKDPPHQTLSYLQSLLGGLDTQYAGIRLQTKGSDNGSSVHVSFDFDESESTLAFLSKQALNGIAKEAALEEAHESLTSAFLQLSTADDFTAWGRKK